MKRRILALLISFLFLTALHSQEFAETKNNSFRSSFYSAYSSEDTLLFNQQIHFLEQKENATLTAFLGAMQMKKSAFLKTPKEKIEVFGNGKTLLEAAIKNENTNPEYRFLRLSIQENCPALLKYKNNIVGDAGLISEEYSRLNKELASAVYNYSKVSSALKNRKEFQAKQ